MGDSTIRGAAQAAARVIEQQAQAVAPQRVAEAVKSAHSEAAKALDAGAQPIIDSAKEMPKQAKAIAKICLDNPALAPLVVPAVPFMMAAKGAVAIHKSHVAIAKQMVASGKEVAHAAHTLSPKEKFKIAANPAYMLLPPGVREVVIAGAIKEAAEAKAKAGAKAGGGSAGAATTIVGRAIRAGAAAAKAKSPNND